MKVAEKLKATMYTAPTTRSSRKSLEAVVNESTRWDVNAKIRELPQKKPEYQLPPLPFLPPDIIRVQDIRYRKMGHNAIYIHEDGDDDLSRPRKKRVVEAENHNQPLPRYAHQAVEEAETTSEDTEEEDEEENEIDESVVEDMRKLEESFRGISQKYRLINRIGEGTFSTVYKAEMLSSDDEDDENTQVEDPEANQRSVTRRKANLSSSQTTAVRTKRKPQYVALKKIYVTSSPSRIANELELLHRLRHSPHICPLLTAFRHLDQVVAVLPYYRHLDFRLYYRDFLVSDMRHYFYSLLSALNSVHKAGILHRDIKPTNFLYDHTRQQGVLVDFGLAETDDTDGQRCLCTEPPSDRRLRYLNSFAVRALQQTETLPSGDQASIGFPKNDSRSSRRANRAGTRGFRAPEVLFKCTSQSTKIDIWSAGVILLTLLARRFPFFNSSDDVDALIELSSIFGKRRMRACAALHGSVYETNIETIGEGGFALDRIILWATYRDSQKEPLGAGELQAVGFLNGLMELDPGKRLSAREALGHAFFTEPVEDDEERELRREDERVMGEMVRGEGQ